MIMRRFNNFLLAWQSFNERHFIMKRNAGSQEFEATTTICMRDDVWNKFEETGHMWENKTEKC